MKNQNIVIASNGKATYVMVDGKVYGDHVVKVEFIHDHKDKPNDARLLITTDCVPLQGDASDEEQLEKLCQPVVDWLKKNHGPHTEVRISAEHIDLVESVIGIPVER